MPQHPSLLCISHSPDLRETRRRVLLTRYAVVAVPSIGALRELTATACFDVLVLCHTLSIQETAEAMRIARENWPGIKILGISAPHINPFRGDADAVLGGLAGPRAMLDAVASLLPPSVSSY